MGMKKIGFWEGMLKDMSWDTRDAFNDAATSISIQDNALSYHSEKLQSLLALDRAQAIEIENLRGIIEVMSDLLVDMKVVDGDILGIRVKDKLAELQEARNPKPSSGRGSPYRGNPGSANPAGRTLRTCTKCKEEFMAAGSREICSSCDFG